MTELQVNFENLPPQKGFKIDYSKLDHFDPYPQDDEEYEEHLEEGEKPISQVCRIFDSNDYNLHFTNGSPGDVFPWHTHSPILHQLYIPIDGEIEVNYKDNEGEIHTTEAEPTDVVYLPPGAHNKIKYLGPGDTTVLIVAREGGVPRLEHIYDDPEKVYDPVADVKVGLKVDNKRGNVLEVNEEATTEY